MEKYWPGALTIIFKKSAKTLPSVTCGLDTIGFRIPNDETALEILKKVGPIATTSINISGQPPLNDYHEIEKEFGDEIDYLFEKEVKSSNVSSTVIDCTSEDIKVLRQGEIIIKQQSINWKKMGINKSGDKNEKVFKNCFNNMPIFFLCNFFVWL